MSLLKIGFSRITLQTLTDSDKILQAYVGRTQISRVKILVPWVKGVQNGGENVGVFVAGNLYVFVTGEIGMKFGKNVNRCPLLNLNRRILKLFPYGGDFVPKRLFKGRFDASQWHRPTGHGLLFST